MQLHYQLLCMSGLYVQIYIDSATSNKQIVWNVNKKVPHNQIYIIMKLLTCLHDGWFYILQVDIKVCQLLSHLSGIRHYDKAYMNEVYLDIMLLVFPFHA